MYHVGLCTWHVGEVELGVHQQRRGNWGGAQEIGMSCAPSVEWVARSDLIIVVTFYQLVRRRAFCKSVSALPTPGCYYHEVPSGNDSSYYPS